MPKYAEMVYNGFWFSPEREALQALVDKTQEFVAGTVRARSRARARAAGFSALAEARRLVGARHPCLVFAACVPAGAPGRRARPLAKMHATRK